MSNDGILERIAALKEIALTLIEKRDAHLKFEQHVYAKYYNDEIRRIIEILNGHGRVEIYGTGMDCDVRESQKILQRRNEGG